jgi:hypothetical protein
VSFGRVTGRTVREDIVDLTAKRGPGGLATAAADGRTSRQHDAPSSIVYSVGYVFEAPAGPVLRAVTRLAGAATVTGVRAFRVGGTGATINARADDNTLLPVDLSVASASTWMSVPSLQNTAVAAGTSLQVEITGVTGIVTYVLVQIDYQVT